MNYHGLASPFLILVSNPHPGRILLGYFFTLLLDGFQVQNKYFPNLGFFFFLFISPVLGYDLIKEFREGFVISQEPIALHDTFRLLFGGRSGVIL